MDFAVPAEKRVKLKESKKNTEILLERWKNVEHEGNGDTNCNWHTGYGYQRIGRLDHKNMSGDYPNVSTIKIGQNTEQSLEDLRKLDVTQNPGRNQE